MRCTNCDNPDTKVIDSRLLQEGLCVRRRRKCEKCETRFTTYENQHVVFPMVVKSDGRRENYDREKIKVGVKKACQKRPISVEQIETLLDQVEKGLLEIGEKEISSNVIGKTIILNLMEIDPVAYIRFASNYWSFDNIDEFVKVLQKNQTQENEHVTIN